MIYLLERTQVGPNSVALLGEDYTGGLVVQVNELHHTYPRDSMRLLVEKMTGFLESTADCPRCGHSRLSHFSLWVRGGHLYGCSHGTGERTKLADGLPCDCPGIPPQPRPLL